MSFEDDLLQEKLGAIYSLLVQEADRLHERTGQKIEIFTIREDPIMTVEDSTLIRIPRVLKIKLMQEAEYLMEMYKAGEFDMPAEYREHVPLHYVIEKTFEVADRLTRQAWEDRIAQLDADAAMRDAEINGTIPRDDVKAEFGSKS